MNSNEILNKISNLDNHIREVSKEAEKLRQEINDIESDAAELKKTIAQGATTAAKSPLGPDLKHTLDTVKHKYKDKQNEKLKASKDKENYLKRLEKHISEAQAIASELKRHQPAMSELEQKIETWTTRADQIVQYKP